VFNAGYTESGAIVYDPDGGTFIISHADYTGAGYVGIYLATVTGTSVSFGSLLTLLSSNGSGIVGLSYDTTANKSGCFYGNSLSTNRGTGVVVTTNGAVTNLTSENYIGISNGAYSDGATATIQIVGSVDDAQTGLTAGQSYYVQNDGSLGTTADTPSVFAGTAISATEIIVKG